MIKIYYKVFIYIKGFMLKENLTIIQDLEKELKSSIIGNEEVIRKILITFLSNWHALLEGYPGIAKTTLINNFSKLLWLIFKRVQFTPDLLPTDILWMSIFHPEKKEFIFKPWPLFSNIILADEINRAPAKVQSALLEAMAERQITVGDSTHKLNSPFCVFATQNNIDNEGTYVLPEAQLDRFMFKINMNFPSKEEEIEIMKFIIKQEEELQSQEKKIFKIDIENLQKSIQKNIKISDSLLDFIASLITATRKHNEIKVGASPRASIAFIKATKVNAFLNGKEEVTLEDILFVMNDILMHRIQLKDDLDIDGVVENRKRKILNAILDNVLEEKWLEK